MTSPPGKPFADAVRGPPGIIALGATVALAHASLYRSFVTDDAWISLVYSSRLIDGLGLTWTDMVRVEGYSNLLWVLTCAGLGGLGVDLLTAARILSMVGLVMCVAAIAAVLWRQFRPRRAPAWVGVLLFALSGPAAAWVFGGLETLFLAALLAWAIAFVLEALGEAAGSPWPASVLLGAVCLTRVDGMGLVALALTAAIFATHGTVKRRALLVGRLGAGALVAILGQLTFRWIYYRDLLPNTAYAKVHPSAFTLIDGLAYLTDGLMVLAPMVILSVCSLVSVGTRRTAAPRMRPLVWLTWLVTVGWLGYIVIIGGDWMRGYRHFVVVLPLMAMSAGAIVERVPGLANASVRLAAATAIAALVAIHGAFQFVPPDLAAARVGLRWEWDCRTLARSLRRAYADVVPLIAVDVAGCYPYFTGFPSIDMLGLADKHIARQPSNPNVHHIAGHARGDGRYVLQRRPDLVMFCGIGDRFPCFVSGRELLGLPEFHAAYRPINITADPTGVPKAVWWMRTESEKIGIQRRGDNVWVPALLWASGEGTAKLFDAGTTTQIATIATLDDLRLEAGSWRVRVQGTELNGARLAASGPNLTFEGGAAGTGVVHQRVGGEISISIAATSGPLEISGLMLEQ